jgi:glycosyltransferase involved in cell wall biosynthesis
MLTSNDYTGRYWQDLASGFVDTDVELGFASFGMILPPRWHKSYPNKHIVFGNSGKWNLRCWLRFILEVKDYNPDVIQSHLFHGGLLGVFLSKLLKKPVVYTRHHLDEHFQTGTRIHRFLDKLIIKQSPKVITCSEATKLWIVKQEGALPEKVKVIYQGFDFDRIRIDQVKSREIRKNLQRKGKKFNILCVSRFSKVKGQTYLLDAISMNSKLIESCQLTFIGIGDPTWLVKEIMDRNLQDCCTILGPSSEVLEYMHAHDLIVHPSLADSFSQTIIEAMALGKCIVAANTAAVPEQIINLQTGIIVPQRDSIALMKSIELLMSNRNLIEQIGSAARKAVRRKFPLGAMISDELRELRLLM